MNRLNLLAGVLCLGGVAVLTAVFGFASLTATTGTIGFSGFLTVAGCLFSLAATERKITVAGRSVDLHDCSGLGDVAVGLAIFAGLASRPSGIESALYVLLVTLGGVSAVLFGVVGLAEKYDRI